MKPLRKSSDGVFYYTLLSNSGNVVCSVRGKTYPLLHSVLQRQQGTAFHFILFAGKLVIAMKSVQHFILFFNDLMKSLMC